MLNVIAVFNELGINPSISLLVILTIGVLGVGRLTRVIVHDPFPPTAAIRMAWDKITNDGPWSKLFHCWWCMSHWVAAVAAGWGIWSIWVDWLGWAWIIFWGWFAIGYVAAIVIAHDEPAE